MSIIQEIKVLQEIVNDRKAIIAKIYFQNGDRVRCGDEVVDLETSKAVFNLAAEKDGYIEYLCREKEEFEVGQLIVRIYDEAAQVHQAIAARKPVPQAVSASRTLFSAAALKLIENENLDKSLFADRDFVSAEDVRKALNIPRGSSQDQKASSIDPALVQLKPISRAKELEINNLKEAQSANLSCVVAVLVDVENIQHFAGKHLGQLKDSLLPFIIYESARLLGEYPEFNAFFSDGKIALYRAVHVGLAVDLGLGLKVLKIPDTAHKDIKSIETQVLQLADKYLDKKLTLDDVCGYTFTITDLSQQGVHFFTPLIGKHQSAILGIASVDAKFKRCTLTLTFDHRVTEGKRAAEFLNALKGRLESYADISDKTDAPAGKNLKCTGCFATLDEIRSMKGMGLIKIIDCDGHEQYLCEVCWGGWA